MFKGILPAKRIPSTDFTMITNLGDLNGKENMPGGAVLPPASKSKGLAQSHDKKRRGDTKKGNDVHDQQSPDGFGMNMAFDKLLDDLQIPSILRPKLVGMDATVKAAMLKSSQTMVITGDPSTPLSAPATSRAATLHRAHSIESIASPRASMTYRGHEVLQPPHTPFAGGQVSSHHVPSVGGSPASRKSSAHMRGLSYDASNMLFRSQGKEKSAAGKNISPTRFFSILSSKSSIQLDVEDIKKLRLLLRNETASWSEEFLALGGYSALLTRLNEILEVEWREEQHDDKILHELLRCFKALSTSSIGCFALRSSCPMPFVQLIALLYSDKKPGDVATRQLIADLLLILFEIYPSSSLPPFGNSDDRTRPHRESWEADSNYSNRVIITLPVPHRNLFSLIRALLLTPAPPPTESPGNSISPHAFIESLHRPRIYKTYFQELSDICRDYFWVFCHPNNTIWVLSETDEGKVEKPRAPGGMTGGVEFEAIGYFTTHLRLMTALARAAEDLNLPRDHEHSAYRFHSDLFLSGLERIILISRKASTTYYPTLHLELARYIACAITSGYELPYTVSRLIGRPPTGLTKSPPVSSGCNIPSQTQVGTTPTKRGGLSLPSPQKIEPIRFE